MRRLERLRRRVLERVAMLLLALAVGAMLVASPARAQEAPSYTVPAEWGLHVEIGSSAAFYPGQVYGPFELGYLTSPGCSPLYLTANPSLGCPVYRDEPAWADLSLRWTGPGLAQVWPRDGRWARVWGEDDRRRYVIPYEITATDASGRPLADGAVEMADGADVHVRVDFSQALASMPAGYRTVCVELSVTILPDASIRGQSRACIPLLVIDGRTHREEAERLRRKAIDLVAAYRCDEALETIEELLRLHPSGAPAFRLRGIVEELQQRNRAAVADYGRAIWLLRNGEDRWLASPGVDFRTSADDIAAWRDSMKQLLTFAPELSLLGPAGERPTCKSTTAP